MADQANRHYPSRQKAGDLHDDFRILYDHVYEMRDQLKAAHGRIAELERKGTASGGDAGSPAATKIGGLYVKASVPANGQKLTYNAASGQIEWA